MRTPTTRLPLAAFAVGLIVTALATFTAWRSGDQAATQAITGDGEILTSLLNETIELGTMRSRSIAALFEASENVTQSEFSRFALRQGPSPGVTGMGLAQVVPAEDLDRFVSEETQVRSWFVLMDHQRRAIRSAPDRLLVPITYSHQTTVGPTYLGVDLASDPARLATIEQARRSGDPTVSPFVSILGGANARYIEIYTPSISGDFEGVAYATLNVEEMASEGARLTTPGEVSISDVTGSDISESIALPDQWADTVEVGERIWLIEISRSRAITEYALPLVLAVEGLLLSVLASLLSASYASAAQRRQELAEMKRITAEKDFFLAAVAHELRTPLTAVVGVNSMLANEWRQMDPESTDELLAVAAAEATDLADLIDDLLVAGRIDAGAIHFRTERVDMGREIRRVIRRLNPGVSVKLDLPEPSTAASADSVRVRQIIRNIVLNGGRYARTELMIAVANDGEVIHVEISNDGPAIEPDLAAVLFEPYRDRATRPYQVGAIGMRLPVSRRLANLMGGDLDYTYRDDTCVFTLTLPAYPDDEIRSVEIPAAATTPPASAARRGVPSVGGR